MMIRNRLFFITSILAILSMGCNPELERPNIPISCSLRLDATLHWPTTIAELQLLDSLGLRTFYVEIPMEANPDSFNLPKLNRTALVQLSKLIPLLKDKRFNLGILITQTEFRPLFPTDTILDPPAWFAKYLHEVNDLLLRCKEIPIQRIVLGAAYYPVENYAHAWKQFSDSVHTQTNATLTYSAFASEAPSVPGNLWAAFDEIGIMYEAPLDGNYKRSARMWNQAVSELAIHHQKNVFISHCNLIGAEKDIQLLNRFRFWATDVTVSGINLNCIYPNTILTDTTGHFGMLPGTPGYQVLQDYVHAFE